MPKHIAYKDLACKTKEILETHEWIQHRSKMRMSNGEVGYCLLGAMQEAYFELDLRAGSFAYADLIYKITAETNTFGIPTWNDAPGRTKEEVIAIVEKFCD